jgi:hypothetical protein
MDTERPPHGTIRINCECCLLRRVIRDRDGAIPRICDMCYPHHRGELPETRVARAESHEVMLRELLTACRASEERAQTGRTRARDRMIAAFESRGILADRLVEAAESDRGHDCTAQRLGRDARVVEYARKHRLHQDSYWESD